MKEGSEELGCMKHDSSQSSLVGLYTSKGSGGISLNLQAFFLGL